MLAAVVVAAGVVQAETARQDARQAEAGRLGTVRFANSCAADVQPAFARAMALLHSFEFNPAIEGFEAIAKQDPSCAMAYWGLALAQWGNPFSATTRPAAQLEPGRAAIEKARTIGAKTARERDYIQAAAALYDRFATVDQRTRMLAYRDQMARVAAAYPADPEASTFYALALAFSADPADKTYADQLKAGAMLERLWAAQPDHPGIAHYIIHSYDVPALAPRALAAARRYATVAPAAPHALHMPSHTFTRLGYWDESIATNLLSAEAARRAGSRGEQLHAIDYLVYAYLQTGQDEAAKRLAGAVSADTSADVGSTGAFAAAAVPARYALERGDWRAAARLEPHASPQAHVEAMTWFARAIGSARSGDAAGARAALGELQARHERERTAHEAYWTEQTAIQTLAASAWLALAEGRPDEALTGMRAAADREDRTEKSAVSPGPLAPAREMLGEMLLQLGRPAEAIVELRTTMAKEPNRFRGLADAAAAAGQAGDRAAARTFYSRLATICAKGDTPGRPELQTARAAR